MSLAATVALGFACNHTPAIEGASRAFVLDQLREQFSDVLPQHPHFGAIAFVSQHHIIEATEGDRFEPERIMVRGAIPQAQAMGMSLVVCLQVMITIISCYFFTLVCLQSLARICEQKFLLLIS